MFYYVKVCLTMFSKLHNDRRRHIGNRAAADRLRDGDNASGIGDNSAEIGDGAVGSRDRRYPCERDPILNSVKETGVTLFLEDKFQRGGFQGQGQCFLIGLSCSIPTIVFYSFSLSVLSVYRLMLWCWGLRMSLWMFGHLQMSLHSSLWERHHSLSVGPALHCRPFLIIIMILLSILIHSNSN